MKNILLHGQDIFLVLKLYSEVQSLYTYPFTSSHIDVLSVKTLRNSITVVPLGLICCKCVRLPLDKSSFAVMPLLHSGD